MLYLFLMTSPENRGKAIAAQTMEEERYRLARSLQGGTAHLLANAVLEIENCLKLMDVHPESARQGMTDLVRELHQGLGDLRELIAELQPPLLDELGLSPSVKKYTDEFARRTGIQVTLRGWRVLVERLPSTVETALFRIIQEALENVRQHSRASRAELVFTLARDHLQITISDNGAGFDPTRGVLPRRRLGLAAMRDRAESIGGTLHVFSKPGRGVRVMLVAPLRVRSGRRGEYAKGGAQN
ncbi:MAG: sensor histidine kinase [Chloroflexi bacterium]|nr:sensor histidine kinase [Chloroflexota bacterium]